MESVSQIRRWVLVEGRSIRSVARVTELSRNTDRCRGTRIKVAHFRLRHSRKPLVVAYPGESQEMVRDAFVQALSFHGGVVRRVIINNPKTMVT